MVFRQRRRLDTGAGIRDKPEGRTAAFSVHDDKPLESLNSIFFGHYHREPRHGSVNRAIEYLHTCRPEPKVTTDKINRKKCYLEILGAIFRTEKAAVRPSGLSCIPAPEPCLLRCRKTIPVPYSSGFITPTPPKSTLTTDFPNKTYSCRVICVIMYHTIIE